MVIYDREKKELTIPVGWGNDMEAGEKLPYEGQYFTVEMLSDGMLSFSGTGVFSFSVNEDNWQERSVNYGMVSISLAYGSTVRISSTPATRFGLTITSEVVHTVYGNAMSLLYGAHFRDKTEVGALSLQRLFYHNNGLTDASNLILPATTLATRCYQSMFQGCSNLRGAPALPSTTLAASCYMNMFDSCKSILSPIELPAEYLVDSCYAAMFRHSNVEIIKCHAINPDIESSTYVWLKNTSTFGTFYCPEGVEWERGDSGIPEGWEIKNLE